MPAVDLREQTADQRPYDGTDIDARAEDDEAASAPGFIFARIKRAHLRRDIALEQTGTYDEQQERQQKRLIEGHGEMTRAHRQRADDHCIALTDPAVGNDAAKHRREVDETGVKPRDV